MKTEIQITISGPRRSGVSTLANEIAAWLRLRGAIVEAEETEGAAPAPILAGRAYKIVEMHGAHPQTEIERFVDFFPVG